MLIPHHSLKYLHLLPIPQKKILPLCPIFLILIAFLLVIPLQWVVGRQNRRLKLFFHLVVILVLALGGYALKEGYGDVQLNQQLYSQALNAATPNQVDLDMASNTGAGMSYEDADYMNAVGAGPAGVEGNQRAERISPCAQNAPTFLATDLLPKQSSSMLQNTSGLPSWENEPSANVLANQNFLSSTQRIGTDTVLSSLRNASYDIRSDIPNPWSVPSVWNIGTIQSDLTRRPLECHDDLKAGTMWGCYPGPNDSTYVAPQ